MERPDFQEMMERKQMDPFHDPKMVASYLEGPPRNVPGYEGMLRMATLLLAEHVPDNGRVLVLGAGGGLEIKAFAQAHPYWHFDGVDPSAEMLKLAESVLGPLGSRATLHHGFVEDVPIKPFDAATCLLTFHFLNLEQRRHTLKEVHRRLRPGAPFVLVHLSFPQTNHDQDLWLKRYSAFIEASGVDSERARNARVAMKDRLTMLTPEQDEQLLNEAGFSNVSLFYMGFAFRGWVAYA